MRDLPATVFFGTDKFRKSQVTSRLRIATENATVNTFRPVERTYSTKITRFRRPQTATFRFIAHQACILYHKSNQIATLIYRCFCRNFDDKNDQKYTSCTKDGAFRAKRQFWTTSLFQNALFMTFFLKKRS